MSDKKDGSPIMASLIDSKSPERQEMMVVGAEIYASLIEWYRKQTQTHSMEPLRLGITLATAIGQYSAVAAVDLGMNKEAYLKVSGVFYDNAYKNAPKFG